MPRPRLRPFGAAAVLYLAAAGAATAGWLARSGAPVTAGIALACALPACVGALLFATSTSDPRQYVVRLLAAFGFLPVLLGFWAAEQAGPRWPVWPFAVAASLAHAAAFVGLVAWAGAATTRLAPLATAAPAHARELRARLLALAASAGFVREASDDEALVLVVAASDGRSHRVTLRLVEARRTVLVTERLRAAGDAPRDAREASLRAAGDPAFDPARPRAARVWHDTRQTTLIEPARLAAALAASEPDAPDGEGAVTALCAVVLRAGWIWQPRLFG